MPDAKPTPSQHSATAQPSTAYSATLTLPGALRRSEPQATSLLPGDERAPLLVCVGTRPEIIKMAPVCRALNELGLPIRLLHTGQHRELAAPAYRALGLSPDLSLPLDRAGDSLASLGAALLGTIDPVLEQWRPAALLVHGDTSSAAMAALAGFWRAIPVAHVEAGLRSHQLRDPFPEEMNRSLIARLASWHFAPTEAAVANLRAEGIAPRAIYRVGNTIVDATLQAVERLQRLSDATARADGIRPQLVPGHTDASDTDLNPMMHGLTGNTSRNGTRTDRMIVVTAHRRENWGAPIRGFMRALGAVIAAHPSLTAVWTLHANPALARDVRETHAALDVDVGRRIHLMPPLDYLEMIALLREAWLILTDSGGLQEEACALGVPVLVLRHATERPELIEAGAGRLIGTDPLRVAAEIERLWRDPSLHQAMRSSRNPFGDGQASRRIAAVLGQWYGGERRVEPRLGPVSAAAASVAPMPGAL